MGAWLNENAGVVVLIAAIIVIVMLGVAVWLLFFLKNRIAVQRLNFLGFYSTSMETKKRYADFTIGNKSLNDIGIAEIGLKNGGISFRLTELYREKNSLSPEARIVIEQRSSIRLRLTAEELKRTAIRDGKAQKTVRGLRLYAVDLTGNLYSGRVRAVRRLLKELLTEERAEERAEAEKTAADGADGKNA